MRIQRKTISFYYGKINLCSEEIEVGKLEVGLILGFSVVLGSILVIVYAPFSPFKEVWWEEMNILEKIATLRTHSGGNYSIYDYDWAEWSAKMRKAGSDFTEMRTWEEFKASLEYQDVTFLMLDEGNRVVWYNETLSNQIIYLRY